MDFNVEARNKLGAGRVLANKLFPYYTRILSVMVVVERPGLGKFTADNRWRLYYDPEKVLTWTLDEIATAWIHCVEHIFRQHGQRFNALEDPRKDPELFQQCADVVINEDLKRGGFMMPEKDDQPYLDPSLHPEWSASMGAEEMYFATKATQGEGTGDDLSDSGGAGEQDSPDGTEGDSDPDSASPEGSDADDEKSSGKESESKDDDSSDPSNDDSSDGNSGDSQDQNGTEGDEKDGSSNSSGSDDDDDEEGGDSTSSSSGESDSEDESDSSSGSSSGGDEGEEEQGSDTTGGAASGNDTSGDSSDEGDGEGEGQAQAHDCGSAVDNMRRDYEERSSDDGSVNSVAAENIKKDVAKDIINHANSKPGSVPSSLVREATNIIKPQVDWRKDLMLAVRRGISKKAGQQDRSYKKAARRSLHPKMIMPGRIAPPIPKIAVILDTSGSMSEAVELSIALSEIDNLLKSVARESDSQSLTIINCDAGANVPVVVKNLKDYEMVGGGGTDMRVGINRAAEMKPLFDVIMVITDGFTPWPQVIPQQNRLATYIACIVGTNTSIPASRVPKWMKALEVNMPDRRRGHLLK